MSQPITWPLNLCGFTLIETITALFVACILLSIGIPSFQTLAQSTRMTAAINNISTHLNLARNEAVTRGIDVVLCPSTDGQGCTDTTHWDDGLIMYLDNNKNRKLDLEEQVLRYINAMHADSIQIRSTPGRKKTVYNPEGYVSGYNLTITFCDIYKKVDPKAVIVSNSGRARISSTDSEGNALDCNHN